MSAYLKRTTMRTTNESIVLLRALHDTNLPKLIADDTRIFHDLLTDMFPHVTYTSIEHTDLHQTIVNVLNEHKYVYVQKQIEKILQLYTTMMTNHACMLVGPTRYVLNFVTKTCVGVRQFVLMCLVQAKQ
jgi:dynein heavy chain, axonemal